MLLEPPRRLPVDSLSVSSLNTYLKCPERWRRRYLENEWEPTSGRALVGGAVGRAEGHNYQQKIGSRVDLAPAEVLDAYSDEFDYAREQGGDTIDWEDEKPGRLKDSGSRVLRLYHELVARHVRPTSVERKFVVHPPGVEWTFTGYFDVEAGGRIPDLKTRSPSKGAVSAEEAANELQPTGYLFARRAEGNPADGFDFHNLVRAPNVSPRHVVITPTTRTDEQLDAFLDLLYRVAAEIAWRVEYDVWTGPAPGAWWCSEGFCGFWHTCPLGGGNRPAVAPLRPRPIRKPTVEALLRAVVETTRKENAQVCPGTTTAKRVGDHLGVSTRAAAGHLRALKDRGLVASRRPFKHYKTRPDVALAGPDVYWLVDLREQKAAA